MSVVDLDALKAARQEASGEGPSVRYKKKTFKLPAELPFEVPEALAELATASEANDDHGISRSVTKALQGMFGSDYEKFRKLQPSIQDIQVLMMEVLRQYGLGSKEPEDDAE